MPWRWNGREGVGCGVEQTLLFCLPRLSASASSVCLPSRAHSTHTPPSLSGWRCVSLPVISPLPLAFRGTLPFRGQCSPEGHRGGFSRPPSRPPASRAGGHGGQSHCGWHPAGGSRSLGAETRGNPTLPRSHPPKPTVSAQWEETRKGNEL